MKDFKFDIDFDAGDFDLSQIEEIRIKEAVYLSLVLTGFSEDSYLSYTLVGKEFMQELNKTHKNKNYVTDVLSFPQYDDEGFIGIEGEDIFLGDIVICPERLQEQAGKYGHSYMRELLYISVHSTLHLLGYDHIEEEDKREMREMEKKIMAKLKEVHDDL